MPLDEVSPNIRRSGTGSRSARSKAQGGASRDAIDSLPPSSIRGMLKTSTETGDIGQFSVRPSRLPRSGSRLQTTRQRSGSFDTSFASALRHRRSPQHHSRRRYGPGLAQSLSGLSRQDTIRSNLNSYYQNPRSRMRSYRLFPNGLEGLTSPPSGPRGLYSHRSLMTLRSQQDVNSTHSNSPHAYAARMIDPGPRANSPAFSDAHFYVRRMRYNNQYTGSVGTAASSPASMAKARQDFPGYHPDLNGSFSSLIRLPSPAVPSHHYGVGRHYLPSRANTPIPASFRGLRAESNCSVTSLPRLPKSPTGSSTPQYYDYTESFIEEDYFAPEVDITQSSLPFNMDQTILENGPIPTFSRAQTPFGTRPGSSFHPSELPTNHNRRPSERSNLDPPIEIPCRTSSLNTSILSAEQKAEFDKVVDDSRSSLEKGNEDADLRRASSTSRRTCTSSRSSLFFPNASRSPRDLTSLAARVHSPSIEQPIQRSSPLAEIVQQAGAVGSPGLDSTKPRRPILPAWQLPSLNFRPLSLASYADSQSDRPRTANFPGTSPPEIISPTPERPMSSQSRKRFTRILEIEDDYCTVEGQPGPVAKSFNSLNFSRLKRLEEVPESAYPARLSIPPYNPRNSGIREDTDGREIDIINAYTDARSSHNTSNERSTIESLLERHIDCLGLQPDQDFSTSQSDDDDDDNGTGAKGTDDITLKLQAENISTNYERKRRPNTSRSWNHSSFESADRFKMVPKRLFSDKDRSRGKLAATGSLPCMSEVTITERNSLPDRPSMGWQTLASTSQFSSERFLSKPSLLSGELADLSSEGNPIRFKLKRRSEHDISPSSSSIWTQGSGDLDKWDEFGTVHRRLREDLDRNSSHRRRRIRLKLKKNSLSVGRLTQNLTSPDETSVGTTSVADLSTPIATTIETTIGALPELSAEPVHHVARNDSKPGATACERPVSPGSPPITHRWSSIVSGFPKPAKQSFDVVRKPSIQTIRSHRSNTSLAEPINSTRLSAQILRLGSVPCLAPPEFGPPLTTSDLNLSLPYAEVPSTIRPTLRETRSFFSDDSSALHNTRGSIRKRFNLHSFRSTLPSSPRELCQSLRSTPRAPVGGKYIIHVKMSAESRVNRVCQWMVQLGCPTSLTASERF